MTKTAAQLDAEIAAVLGKPYTTPTDAEHIAARDTTRCGICGAYPGEECTYGAHPSFGPAGQHFPGKVHSRRITAYRAQRAAPPTLGAPKLATSAPNPDGAEISKTMRAKLRTEIRRNLKRGEGPCTSARKALRTLHLDKIIGVQGDDDEVLPPRNEDHFELHYVDGRAELGISLDLVGKRWTV